MTGGQVPALTTGSARDEPQQPPSRGSSAGSSRDENKETREHDSRSCGLGADYVESVQYLSREFPELLDAVSTPMPSNLTPAVADGVFDLEYFRNFQNFTGGYKQHNAALKWFRQILE